MSSALVPSGTLDKLIAKKKAKGKKKRTPTADRPRNRNRKPDPRGIVIIEEQFKQANDPAQLKLLTKIQVYLREQGSRFGVVPSLHLTVEIDKLRRLEKDTLAQAQMLRDAIAMAEKTKLYKRLLETSQSTLKAEDAFKFT